MVVVPGSPSGRPVSIRHRPVPDELRRAVSVAVDVCRLTIVLALLTVVVAVGVHAAAAGLAATVPAAEFGYAYDAGADSLTITHERGDSLRAGSLRVTGAPDTCQAGAWRSGTVAPGDTCVLRGVDGTTPVTLVWHGNGEHRAVIDVWTAPDAERAGR